uniref:MARVEL domain-containing protein n=1 Tax=Strongyloides venezuelensis TaxID=75913 RepID=A0A0K0FZS0_STRVS
MINIQVNWKFLTARPYGIILTGRMISSVTLTILMLSLRYKLHISEILTFINAFIGFWSIISLTAHFFNLQKNLSTVPDSYFYIPFAIVDFIFGIFGAILYTIETFIVFMGIINSYYYYLGDFLLILLTLVICIVSAVIFGYYSLLLHVQTQNIKDLPIKEMVIEGDKITYYTPSERNNEKTLILKTMTI